MLRRFFALAALATALIMIVSGCGDDCVECPKEDPILHLDKHKLSLGSTATTASVAISNKGEQTLSWSVSVSPSTAAAKLGEEAAGGWLTVSPLTGSGDGTITCSANRAKLTALGISRAVLIIDAPSAANTTRDSVEVTIVKPMSWLVNDDDTFDSCAVATIDDYYWVKEFHLPPGTGGAIIDTIRLSFCAGNEAIQLLAFDWTSDNGDPTHEKYPGRLICASPAGLATAAGWNDYVVNWHITADTFYLGYFQLGSTSPTMSIDNSPGGNDSTGCWIARDVNANPDPDSVELNWFREGVSKTLAMRAHVIPAFQYLGKAQSQGTGEGVRELLADGCRRKGVSLLPVDPLPREQ